MYTKKEYFAKHHDKFAKLNKTEKEQRWKAYLASQKKNTKTSSRNQKPNLGPLSPQDECLANYAASIANPFDTPPTCVPVFPTPMSRKVKYFARGTLATGTSGYGWIIFAPLRAVCSSNSFSYTDNVYTQTNNSNFVNSGTGIKQGSTNAEFAATAFGSDSDELKFRLVSAGIRVKWAGTTLNRGGTIRAMCSVNHNDMSSYESYESLGDYRVCKIVPVREGWTDICWTPVERHELDFSNGSTDDRTLAIAIQTPTGGVTAPFDYEVVGNYEIIGALAPGKTPSYTSSKTESFLGSLNAPSWLNFETVGDVVRDYGPAVYNAYRNLTLGTGGSRLQLLTM